MNNHSPEVEKAINEIGNGNYSVAFNLLLPLAESGNPEAMANLAVLYQAGWGVPADARKAVELYTKVGEMNIHDDFLSGTAFHNLATIYTTGAPGVDPDIEKTEKYNELAKKLGFDM